MNKVILIGRLTKDPDVRYSSSGTAVARFNVALDKGKDKDGNDLGADYPSCVAFGKTAELIEKYLAKGRQVGIEGRLQTGFYEKDGTKIYTTDVTVDRIEFLGSKSPDTEKKTSSSTNTSNDDIPSGFEAITDDDIPF